MYKKIAVLMGGGNREREVSLQSGKAVFKALKSLGVESESIDVGVENYQSKLISGDFDCAFIALHGGFGENGTIQGFLECIGLPYTGSGVKASSLAMDKLRSKIILAAAGLPVLPIISPDSNMSDLSLPLVVKPVFEGSSVGVVKVTEYSQLSDACDEVSKFGDIMIEPWVEGDEITVGIVGKLSLPSIKIVPTTEFYDYEAKYISDSTQYLSPGSIDENDENYLADLAIRAFDALGCSSWGRVDFIRCDKTGKTFILEVNTIPGLTEHSLVPKAAGFWGWDFEKLILNILEEATVPEGHGNSVSVRELESL